ncbi:hypothetical protein B0H14DRAFT_3878960 [Mycena olivaceomarginata]|nr:hypothetical protein B0H14DRAFT_3878960 [Mycena olivaceomarginata]
MLSFSKVLVVSLSALMLLLAASSLSSQSPTLSRNVTETSAAAVNSFGGLEQDI